MIYGTPETRASALAVSALAGTEAVPFFMMARRRTTADRKKK